MLLFICALMLTFIIRLRFPVGESIASIIRRRYGPSMLKTYRTAEWLGYRAKKIQLDLEFLYCCRQQNLTPKFLHFRSHNNQLRRSRLYRNCQRRFLNNEIRSKRRLHKQTLDKFNASISHLKNSLKYSIDFNHLSNLIESSNEKSLVRIRFVHQRKLRTLGYIEQDALPHDKVIFNFSTRVLTTIEKTVLSKGLKFAIHDNKPKFLDHFLPFEKLFKHLSRYDFYDNANKSFDYFKGCLKHLAFSSYYSNDYNSTSLRSLTKEEFTALK